MSDHLQVCSLDKVQILAKWKSPKIHTQIWSHFCYYTVRIPIFSLAFLMKRPRALTTKWCRKYLKSLFLAPTGVLYPMLCCYWSPDAAETVSQNKQTNTQLSDFGSHPWHLYYSARAAVGCWIISTTFFITAMLNHSSLGKFPIILHQEMSTQNAGDLSLSEPEHRGHLGPHDLQHP